MGFEHLWPLLFLAFVPGIVLLYLLKQKRTDQESAGIKFVAGSF